MGGKLVSLSLSAAARLAFPSLAVSSAYKSAVPANVQAHCDGQLRFAKEDHLA